MNWDEFEARAPDLAATARELLVDADVALLGTLRRDGAPRISCVQQAVGGQKSEPRTGEVHRSGDPAPMIGEGGDYQVLSGGTWIRTAREAGMDRIPVRTLELTEASAAFLALVLNQARPADVAAQADALQALLEAGADEQELARITGLGRVRLHRLVGLLELHPVLRQALREGQLGAPVAFAAAGLAEASQQTLADIWMREGRLSTADLHRTGEGGAASAGDAAARARRQAEELLRTLEEARITGAIHERVTEVIEELNRLALVP